MIRSDNLHLDNAFVIDNIYGLLISIISITVTGFLSALREMLRGSDIKHITSSQEVICLILMAYLAISIGLFTLEDKFMRLTLFTNITT